MKNLEFYNQKIKKPFQSNWNVKSTCIRLALLLIPLLFNIKVAQACEACNQRQPKLLKGITHGSGPESWLDYVVVIFMVVVTIYSLYATIKCLMRPSEKKYKNIKTFILTEQ